MKKLQVWFLGRKLCEIYPHATRFQVLKWRVQEFLKWCLRMLTIGGVSFGMLYGAFIAGAYFNPTTIFAQKEKLVEVQSKASVMDRIAGCESEGNRKSKGIHFDKKGKVVKKLNNNGTTDIGKYQINVNVWGVTAMEMGYNLAKEKDNEEFAYWLYEELGTEPWSASAKCWR